MEPNYRCRECQEEKPRNDFQKKGGGRIRNVCKSCSKKEDPQRSRAQVGDKFGRLTVTECLGTIYTENSYYAGYICRCDCGKETEVRGCNLRSGATQSCGCLKAEKTSLRMRTKSPGSSVLRVLLYTYKKNAEKRSLPWELTDESFASLVSSPCFYCGSLGEVGYRHSEGKGFRDSLRHNGIDRRDNTKGYTEENSVPCCKICNCAKASLGMEEFLAWVERIHCHIQLTFPPKND